MNGIHPNLGFVVAAAAALLAGAVGCSNQPGALKNPFSTADRVPPPSTRVLAPGTAQPYYQGDPLPVMQSATGSAAPGAALASASTPTSVAVPAATAPTPSAEPKKLVFSNEPTIAIPSDGNSLRFELPPPEPPEPEPMPTPSPIANAQGSPPQPTQVMTAPTSTGVVPAAFTNSNPPAMSAQPVTNAAFNAPVEPASTGPWRSPQIAAPTAQPTYAPQAFGQPLVAAPIQEYPPAAAQPGMNVQMRAVASPEPVAPSMPRIRLPGYSAPQPTSGASAGAAAAGMQVVHIAPGPPQGYYDPTLGAFVYTAPPVGSVLAPVQAAPSGNSDGFRPRSSMR